MVIRSRRWAISVAQMKNLVVVGLQWGDEGKGKIVDVLSESFDIVARFQGGSNAGHTVKIGDQVYKFRLMPTGALRGKQVVIGNGVVVDPFILIEEIDSLKASGVNVNLLISDRAHIITPYQILLDVLQEKSKGKQNIGTTKRGIGPTYSDKTSRIGIRATNALNFKNQNQWRNLETASVHRIQDLYNEEIDEATLSAIENFPQIMKRLSKFVADTSEFLHDAFSAGKRVLFEGAQGTLLDIDHGTYPFVTSSNCVSAAAATGTGVSPFQLHSVLGISKAYTTRVGTGPFPTELTDHTGQMIRDKGVEYGTVTGRPRRCGWLDLVSLRYAARLNGAHRLAITKIDVLTGISPLKVCVAYEVDGNEIKSIPADSDRYEQVIPIYEELRGWEYIPQINDGPVKFDDLPGPMVAYLKKIEEWTNSKIAIISTGPDRRDTILVPDALPDITIHV